MTTYIPARQYLTYGMTALGLGMFSAVIGTKWPYAFFASGLFLLTAVLLLVLGLRPSISVGEAYLAIGKTCIPWMDIRRVDRTGYMAPLIVRLTLYDDSRVTLIYPGESDSCKSLLRTLRRMAHDALIDGIPYRQYWGEVLAPGQDRRQVSPQRYRLLLPEDEAEVERLYQLLKTVGHLDPKKTGDEK